MSSCDQRWRSKSSPMFLQKENGVSPHFSRFDQSLRHRVNHGDRPRRYRSVVLKCLGPSERFDVQSKIAEGRGMKNISFVLVAALSLAAVGCKKKGAGGGADCAQAINQS